MKLVRAFVYLKIPFLFVTAVSIWPANHVTGCMWDYDTIMMERQRFPDAHELIVGQFTRHSNVYYLWRIEDRCKVKIEDRTPAQYDDIAVAYDKIGQSEKAIQTIHDKIKRWPDQLEYESQANLGTFYIHNGQYEQGVKHIAKAIEINPEAHFGREIYQQLLVEYIIQQKQLENGDKLPMNQEEFRLGYRLSFSTFVQKQLNFKEGTEHQEFQKAVKGILGMMRFGHYDSPYLLEALGDLLLSGGYPNDSKLLAARAYLKASYAVETEAEKKAYREKAAKIMHFYQFISLEDVEFDLQKEIKQADTYFAQIQSDEMVWEKAGKNLDDEFSIKYYNTPALKVRWNYLKNMSEQTRLLLTLGFILFLITLPVVLLKIKCDRKKRANVQRLENPMP